MSKNITLTQAELNSIIASAVASALAQAPSKSAKAKSKGKGSAKLVEFTKHDGTKVKCTEAQAKAWSAYRDGYTDRVANRDKALATHQAAMSTYKPSKALKDAIKANRAAITFAVAKEKYGFVGTKATLKELKESICK